MSKPTLATIWLEGCSGCHMSILDMDERLLDLAEKVDVIFSPYVDIKEFPNQVDVTLVEGAIATEEDLKKIRKIRESTDILIAFGDCAVTGNVPSMRNPFGKDSVLDRSYQDNATENPQIPHEAIPPLLEKAQPLHEFVEIDLYMQGCPPSADTIHYAISELLEGRQPELTEITRFGK